MLERRDKQEPASKRIKRNHADQHSFMLKHGSLLVMRGYTQRDWMHSVPKRSKVEATRINLTFRCVVRQIIAYYRIKRRVFVHLALSFMHLMQKCCWRTWCNCGYVTSPHRCFVLKEECRADFLVFLFFWGLVCWLVVKVVDVLSVPVQLVCARMYVIFLWGKTGFTILC